jgi:hypothetical protein
MTRAMRNSVVRFQDIELVGTGPQIAVRGRRVKGGVLTEGCAGRPSRMGSPGGRLPDLMGYKFTGMKIHDAV